MNTSSVEAALTASPDFTKTFSWAGNTLTITPAAQLSQNTEYTITVGTGASNLNGEQLSAPYSFSFTTDTLTLSAVNPALGYRNQLMQNIQLTGSGFKKSSSVSIPQGASTYNGHGYQYISTQKTWSAAKTHCESLGGHLVTLSSSAEETFVKSLVPGGQSVWIGMTDEAVEGTFTWITGEPVTYTRWRPGEPNNFSNEDYVEYDTNAQGWNDLNGSANRTFVCEFEDLGAPSVVLKRNGNQIAASRVQFVSSTELIFDVNLTGAAVGLWDVEVTNPDNGTTAVLPAAYEVKYLPPLARDDAYSTPLNQTISASAPGLLGNDQVFSPNALTAIKVSDPIHGALTLNADGSFTYTPSANFDGSDSFTYKVNDGYLDSEPAKVSLYVGDLGGIAGWWKFDEGAGTVASDSSGYGNNGTFSGGVSWNNSGMRGGALNLDGTAIVTVPHNNVLSPPDSWSLCAWVRRNVTGSNHAIVEKHTPSAGAGVYAMRIENDLLSGYFIDWAGTHKNVRSVSKIPANQWVHTAIVFDAAAGRLTAYVNGIAEAFITAPNASKSGTSALKIGAQGDDNNAKFNGALDDVRVYARALNAVEVNRFAQLPPVAQADEYSGPWNQTLTVSVPGVLGNDTDQNADMLTAVAVALPANGTLTLQASGAFSYVPNTNFSGTDSFTYRADDGRGNQSAPATVTLRVTNGAPRVTDVVPVPASTVGASPTEITVTFSEAMDASSISSQVLLLVGRGPDGQFDTADDRYIVPQQVSCTGAVATFTLNGPLLDDAYRFTVRGTVNSGALSFDGGDFMKLANFGSVAPTSEVTIEFWQRANSAAEQSTFGLSPDSGTNRFQAHIPLSNGNVYFDFGNHDSGNGRLQYTPPVPIAGAWNHFALVSSQLLGQSRIYRNGVLEASRTGNTPFVRGAYDLYIGCLGSQTYFFRGKIDDFRIWSVARTQAEIQANMNRSLSGYESGLVAYWDFNDGVGQQARDRSAARRHGTLGASALAGSDDPTWIAGEVVVSGGVRDLSAEILDGEFSGTFPSGNGSSGGDFVMQFTVNASAPVVDSTVPADQATQVPCGAPLKITFSEQMNNAAVEGALSFNPDFSKSFSWSGSTLTITPTAALSQNTSYTLTVTTGALDASGTPLAAPFTLSFTTDFVTLQSVNPAVGYLGGQMSSLVLNGNGFRQGPGAPVPLGVTLFGTHGYQYVNTSMSWGAAQSYCQNLGGHLVAINSAAENSFIGTLVGNTTTWIGLTDVSSEGQWNTWINGEPVTYSNWYPGEPNNSSGIEHRGERIGNGQWNDISDSNTRTFVCEFDGPAAPTVTLRRNAAQIPCTNVQFVSSSQLRFDADLTLAVAGLWDVEVRNPENGALTVLSGGFEVKAQPFQNINASLLQLGASELAWGDIDNDGDLDLILNGNELGNNSGMRAAVYQNTNGSFSSVASPGLTAVEQGGLQLGDYDGDGKLDLLQSGWTGGAPRTTVYKGAGNGTFTTLFNPTGLKQGDGRWFDFDHDGDLDFLVAGENSSFNGPNYSLLYRNNGNQTFTQAASFPGVRASEVEVVDFDNDGDLDILQGGEDRGTLRMNLLQNSGGTFTAITSPFPASEWPGFAWGDFDNDGDYDIAFSGNTSTGLVAGIYRNTGGTFALEKSLPGFYLGDIKWADIDNDGDLDLFVMGRGTGSVKLFTVYINASGTFVESGISLPALEAGEIAFADYDNDGRLDVAISGSSNSGFISRIYRNASDCPVNTAPTAPATLTSLVHGSLVRLSWDAASDTQTPAPGLSYNVRVGTAPGKDDVFAGMSDSSGRRKIVRDGNAQKRTSWALNLPLGTYYWSVQAIDSAFAGSAWAPEQTVVVDGSLQPTIAVSPTALTFTLNEGALGSSTLNLTNPGVGSVSWSVSDNATWLSVSPASGTTTTETDALNVSVDTSGLTPRLAPYTAKITITSPDAFASVTEIPVSLTVSGLMAHWKLDDGSGNTAIDSTANASHGNVINGAWTSGIISGGLSFSGSTYIDAVLDVAETEYTQSLWFKTSNLNAALFSCDAGTLGSSGHDRHVYLYNGNISARLYNNETIRSTNRNYADDTWHHVAYVFGGAQGGQKLYVDGQLIVSGTKTFSDFTTQTGVNIGYSNDAASNYFTGTMDDVRIYNRALSQSEIQALIPDVAPATRADAYGTLTGVLTVAAPGVLANDVDYNGGAISAAKASDPSHGTLLMNADGSFTYTPENGFTGTDTFTYTASDGTLTSTATTVTLIVGEITSGLLAHWKMDETSGAQASDSSGNAYHGTLTNGPLWQEGVLNGGLGLDGVDDHVLLSSSSGLDFAQGQNFTFTGWVRTSDTAGPLIAFRNSNNVSLTIRVVVGYDGVDTVPGKLRTFIRGSNNTQFALTGETVNTNTWRAFALVREGTTLRLYLDGQQQASVTHSFVADAIVTNSRALGRDLIWVRDNQSTTGNRHLAGDMDDIRVYGRALSPAELTVLANKQPIAAGDSYAFAVNTALQVSAPGVLGNDTNPEGETLTAELITPPAAGTLVLNSDGSFTFTPPANYASPALSFSYRVRDAVNRTSNTAMVALTGPAPQLISVAPDRADRGATVELTLTGNNLPTWSGTPTGATPPVSVRIRKGSEIASASGPLVSSLNSLMCTIDIGSFSTGIYDVQLLQDGIVQSTLAGAFTVDDTPFLQLDAPNGGETFYPGQTTTIVWTASGFAGDVDLALSTNGGNTYAPIATVPQSPASYTWTVPSSPSANCKIRIKRSSGATFDVSDTTFTIGQPGAKVIGLSVEPGSTLTARPSEIVALFDKDLLASTSNSANLSLFEAGADTIFGTNDDILISPAPAAASSAREGRIDLSNTALPNGTYRVVLRSDSRAPQFDGGTDRVFVADAPQYQLSNFTLEAWIRPSSNPSFAGQIVFRGDDRSANDPYSLHMLPNGRVNLRIDTANGTFDCSSPSAVPLGTWTHIAGSYTAATKQLNLYINGSHAASATSTANPVLQLTGSNPGVSFGNLPSASDSGQGFSGRIQHVRIWNLARDAAQIQSTMNQALAGSESGLVGCWRLNEGAGQIAYDATAYANHGVLGLSSSAGSDDPAWVSGGVLPGLLDSDSQQLDGEFSGTFPSGDNIPGGDFVAQFTLSRPSVTVLVPNGGQTYYAGQSTTLSWATQFIGGNVDIALSTDGGANYTPIATVPYSPSTYVWTVPNSVSSNCRIRIGPSVGSTSADESDTVFSIQSAPARVTALSFIPGSTLTARPSEIVALFDKDLLASTANSANLSLFEAGADTIFGTNDDILISPAPAAASSAREGRIDLSNTALPNGTYRVVLRSDSRAPQFDGGTDRVFVADAPQYELSNFTLEAWIWPSSNPSFAGQIVFRGDDRSANDPYSLHMLPNGRVNLRIDTANGTFDCSSPSAVPLGTWTHIAGSYTAATKQLNLYINGSHAASATSTANPVLQLTGSNPGVSFGNLPSASDSGQGFAGRIQHVRIWNLARDAAQIQSTMNKALAGNEGGLVGCWRLNEGAGQIAYDATAYANHGVLGLSSATGADDPAWVSGGVHPGLLDSDSQQLDGEFSGTFPSGDNIPGGDFVAQFTLARPSVTVLVPNGGQTYYAGQSTTLSWATQFIGGNVDIALSTDGGANYTPIATVPYSPSTYVWTVPNSVSSNCRIRIGPSVGSTSADESDTVFSIQSAPARVTALSFIPGSTFTQAPASLAISFSLALQGASVNSNTVTVTRAGTDGQTGTGDDQTVALQNLSLNGTSLSIVLPGSLPNDTYTLRLPDGGLKDINGAFVDGEFSGSLPSGNRIPGGAFSASFVLNVQSPVAQAASFNLSEDTPLAGTVSATDANGDVLTYEIVSQPAKGTLVFNTATGAFTYNPDVNQNGNDTFTFRASDGVNVSNTATVTLLIAPVNDVPSAVDLQFTLDEDVPLRGNLQGTDIDSAALTYILQSTPAHGVLEVLENGAFVYRPHTEYSGPDTFTYKVSDGTASSSLARVLLQVNSVNDVPVARRQDLATLEDTPVSGTLKAVDNDGQPLTYRFIASGSLGVALITDAGTGAFTYTPNPNVSGVDVISFVASDGIEDSSSTNIIIAISPVNDAPRAVLSADSTIGVAVGQSVTLDGSGSSDIEGELSFAWDFGDGTVVAAAPALVQHAWSAAGVYTVHLTVTDAEGIKDSVSINVVVSALGGGSSPDRPDSDGDGFSDELEIALNTDPLSASSSPIQNKPLSSVRPLELSKPRITLHLSADGKDSISLKGKLPVRHRMNLAGQKVVVDIGGVIETFVLDARGRSQKSADKSLRLSAKSKYGVVFAQMAPFTLTLRKGTFSDRLSAELHAGEDQKKTPRSLSATVLFDGAYFQTTLQLLVTGNDSMLSAK